MDKDIEYLEKTIGKAQPFKVPEGYFEGLGEQIMAKLPTEDARVIALRPDKWRIYRPLAIAAASVAVAIFSVGMYLRSSDSQPSEKFTQLPASTSYSAFDQAADYTMLDNEDMYAYLADY
ncbi:MAG: hypothetical protein IJK42_08130 [Prevotella sp.]|nr:hypothetical protein [Prevotella sp.]MBQ6209724.1 hypothetical protein [Prevotella sp.]